MRNFLIKYFGRLLAIIGCSTMVTACYGVPYDEYIPREGISGRVVDSETGEPIKGIKVRAVPSTESFGTTPYDSSVLTDEVGHFVITFDIDSCPPGYTIKCTDVDGDLNGSYKEVITKFSYEGDTFDLVIKMTPKQQ